MPSTAAFSPTIEFDKVVDAAPGRAAKWVVVVKIGRDEYWQTLIAGVNDNGSALPMKRVLEVA